MGEVWTLAEFSHGKLSSVSNELLNRGKNLAEKLNTALASVLGYNVKREYIDELIARGGQSLCR